MVKEGKKFTGPEQVREAAQGSARIRGDTLGIVGLGNVSSLFYSVDINLSISFNKLMQNTLLINIPVFRKTSHR